MMLRVDNTEEHFWKQDNDKNDTEREKRERTFEMNRISVSYGTTLSSLIYT